MADPYWRYGADRAALTGGGSIPGFPGYLPSEASSLPRHSLWSSSDPLGTSDFLHKDILTPRPGAYGVDGTPSFGVRPEPVIGGFGTGVRPEPAIGGFGTGVRPEPAIGGFGTGVRPEPVIGGFGTGVRPEPVTGGFGTGVHPEHVIGGYSSSVLPEPMIGGFSADATTKGYSGPLNDPHLLGRRDSAIGIGPGVSDIVSERPDSLTKVDGLPAANRESNVLFIDGLPNDCSRREVSHLFRPFIGFREIRVVHKEPRSTGDKAMVLCFVEFTDSKCALTALEALQGYKFDNKKPESPSLRIHFAHFPFRLPSDLEEPHLAAPR